MNGWSVLFYLALPVVLGALYRLDVAQAKRERAGEIDSDGGFRMRVSNYTQLTSGIVVLVTVALGDYVFRTADASTRLMAAAAFAMPGLLGLWYGFATYIDVTRLGISSSRMLRRTVRVAWAEAVRIEYKPISRRWIVWTRDGPALEVPGYLVGQKEFRQFLEHYRPAPMKGL